MHCNRLDMTCNWHTIFFFLRPASGDLWRSFDKTRKGNGLAKQAKIASRTSQDELGTQVQIQRVCAEELLCSRPAREFVCASPT